MKNFSNIEELITDLTTGHVYDMKILSITTGVVEAGMTVEEAVDEQLDIIYDELLRSQPKLGGSKQRLEESLRKVGQYWMEKLGGS